MNKRTGNILLCSLLLMAGCAPETKTSSGVYEKEDSSSNVIYGSDGRLDVYQVSDERLKKLADSTVALIKSSELITNGNTVSIKGETFGTAYNLCSSEKFQDQPTSAFCSGSLVGEDTIITAGHCIQNSSDCSSTSFVFGYAVKNAGILPSTAPASEVYKCKSIVKQILESNGTDFAIIQLDRKVSNHPVLQLRESGEPQVGDPLNVIGHPTGLPTKITTGGQVRSLASPKFLVASVDTYGGNSGSAVFNANTGLIEGILVRGERDFIRQGSCTISNVCVESSCRGEDITRISEVRPFLPGVIPPPPPPPPPVNNSDLFASKPSLSLAIPDNSTIGAKSSLAIDKLPTGRKVLISIDLSHTYIGDLVISVVSPSGKVAVLHSRAGGSSDNIKKTYEVTSLLSSEQKTGIYSLQIQDRGRLDIGQLNSWSIEFKP